MSFLAGFLLGVILGWLLAIWCMIKKDMRNEEKKENI